MSYIGAGSTKPYIGKRSATSTTTTTPIVVERGPFDTWADLPVTGLRRGELVDVNDMTGSPRGYTGDGSAMWDGEEWVEQGGTPPQATGGVTRHAYIQLLQTVTDAVFDVTTSLAHYTLDAGSDTDGTIGASAAEFADDENIDVLNEIGGSVKPDVVWLSPTRFRYPGRLDPIDRIQVQMP